MNFVEIIRFGYRLNKIRKEIGKMGKIDWSEKAETIVVPLITMLLSILNLKRFTPTVVGLAIAIGDFIDAGLLQKLIDAIDDLKDSPETRNLWTAISDLKDAIAGPKKLTTSAMAGRGTHNTQENITANGDVACGDIIKNAPAT